MFCYLTGSCWKIGVGRTRVSGCKNASCGESVKNNTLLLRVRLYSLAVFWNLAR